MPQPNPFSGIVRVLVATALVAWLAAAIWILVVLIAAEPTREHSPFQSLGMLLFPAVLFAALSLVLTLAPRRAAGAWVIVFVFSLAGLLAWLFLRGPAYQAVPWVDGTLVAAAVWMTLGLILGLIALSLAAVRRVPEPPGVHVAVQFTGSPTRPNAEQVTGAQPLVEHDPRFP